MKIQLPAFARRAFCNSERGGERADFPSAYNELASLLCVCGGGAL